MILSERDLKPLTQAERHLRAIIQTERCLCFHVVVGGILMHACKEWHVIQINNEMITLQKDQPIISRMYLDGLIFIVMCPLGL